MKFLAILFVLSSVSAFAQTETTTTTNDGIVPETKEVKVATKTDKKAMRKMKKAQKRK